MGFEALLILLLICANGFFAGSETAIITARRYRLEHLKDQGCRSAQLALLLSESPGQVLSAVQVGITSISIFSGAIGGSAFAVLMNGVVGDAAALVGTTGVIAFCSVVFGELVPKKIALAHPERTACFVAPMMWRFSRLSLPLVQMLSRSAELILGLLGIAEPIDTGITEDEVMALIRLGADAGIFEEAEQDIARRALSLGDVSVDELMTPRTRICWLNTEDDLSVNLSKIFANPHSIFPVAQGSLDACLGVVRARTVLAAVIGGAFTKLEPLLESPFFLAVHSRLPVALEQFRSHGIGMALVTTEFGGVEGLITLTDLAQGVIGRLPTLTADHRTADAPRVVRREDGSLLVDGALDLDLFKRHFGPDLFDEEEFGPCRTVGGFVLGVLGGVPRESDRFEWKGIRFEVLDVDDHRVDKLLVLPSDGKRSN